MTNLKKRERAKTNASLISMVQRFSDITIMFAGLWLVCEVSGLSFLYMHLLVALITLVVFQMLGGITDFYRSWRGVRAATEFALLLQNWTLSVIFSAGLDPLRDENFAFVARLKEAGVPVKHVHFPGMVHAFLMLDNLAPQQNQQLYQDTASFVAAGKKS